jgi:hypothetical protein
VVRAFSAALLAASIPCAPASCADDGYVFEGSGELAIEKIDATDNFRWVSNLDCGGVLIGPIASSSTKIAGKLRHFDSSMMLYGMKFGVAKSFRLDQNRFRQASLSGGVLSGKTSVFDSHRRFDVDRKDFAIAASARFSSCSGRRGFTYATAASICINAGVADGRGDDAAELRLAGEKPLGGAESVDFCHFKIHDSCVKVDFSETHGFFRRGDIELGCMAGVSHNSVWQSGFCKGDDGDQSVLRSLRHSIINTTIAVTVEDMRSGPLRLLGKLGWVHAALRKHSDLSADGRKASSGLFYGQRDGVVTSLLASHQPRHGFAYVVSIENCYCGDRSTNSANLTICYAF